MTLTLTDVTETIPLRTDESGTIRIGKSRVTLDTIIEYYKMGSTIEELAKGFPTLAPADIMYVIGYYLRHTTEVEAYLAEQEAEAEIIRQKIESDPRNIEFRAKLKERIEKRKSEI